MPSTLRPAGPPTAHFVRSAAEEIRLGRLGPQMLFLKERVPHDSSERKAIGARRLSEGLRGEKVIDIIGTGPDDAWGLTSTIASERTGAITLHVARRSNGRWLPVRWDVELEPQPPFMLGANFTMTSPGTAVLLTLKFVSGAPGNVRNVLTTIRGDVATSREVRGPFGGVSLLVGLASGDMYIAGRDVLVHVSSDGREDLVKLPVPTGDVKELEITALETDGHSPVVAFQAKRAGVVMNAIGVLRGDAWKLETVPFGTPISNFAVSPDGAWWVADGRGQVWRHVDSWEQLGYPAGELLEAKLEPGKFDVSDIVALSAEDAWVLLRHDKSYTLFHTKVGRPDPSIDLSNAD